MLHRVRRFVIIPSPVGGNLRGKQICDGLNEQMTMPRARSSRVPASKFHKNDMQQEGTKANALQIPIEICAEEGFMIWASSNSWPAVTDHLSGRETSC
jgi:hypothetical protein